MEARCVPRSGGTDCHDTGRTETWEEGFWSSLSDT